MKLTTLLIFFVFTSVAYSQDETSFEIEKRINYLKNNPQIENISKKVEIRAEKSLQAEKNLLENILNGYNHLKKYSVSYRYEYMHKALQAASSNTDVKNQRLLTWVEKVNQELLSRRLHEQFTAEWKTIYAKIKSAIHESNKVLEAVPLTETISIDHNDEIRFLTKIKQQLSQDMKLPVPNLDQDVKPALYTEYVSSFINQFNSSVNIPMGFGLAILAISMLYNRKPKTKKVKAKVEKSQIKSPDPQVIATFNKPLIPASNLETSYIECLKRNDQLIKQAEIKVLNGIKSPFKSVLNIPQERLDHALNFLLQGTLAIANTSATKASHMEWNCTEQEGRYSLNLILHGISCDERSLFLNTVIDSEFSGPAYFSRAEQTLEEHQSTVIFKSNQQKTTISLSLDNLGSNNLQSH